MAKNLTYTRKTVESVNIKGILNNEGTEITYIDEDKVEQIISVSDLLGKFCAQAINFSVKVQSEEDLTEDLEEQNEFYVNDVAVNDMDEALAYTE